MTKKTTLLAFAAVAMMFTACRRDNKTTIDDNISTEDVASADEIARTQQFFEEVDYFADEATVNGSLQMKGGSTTLSKCATVSIDTTGTTDSLVIDFGTTNCLCNDGRFRRGQIIITQTGKYKVTGFNRQIIFNGYHVNDNLVFGSKSITNVGKNPAGNTDYSVTVNGGIVLNATLDTISHTASRTRTYAAGENTPQIADDEYYISGSGTHRKASGKTFAINIKTPLYIAMNCKWIKSGVVDITPQGASSPRSLDYGNGTCDDQATITVNGKTKNITLK